MVDHLPQLRIVGELMGRRSRPGEPKSDEIIRVTVEYRPQGPALNALLLITPVADGRRISKYISWIGYHDIEIARAKENTWRLIEPAEPFVGDLMWTPFGAGLESEAIPHAGLNPKELGQK